MRRLLVACGAALLAGVGSGCGGGADADGRAATITVAAAADLRPAFTELAEAFERDTGTTVTLSFGSSGQLARQLVNGAPFDLFASASAEDVETVLGAGRGDPATKTTYAYGRVVVWSRDRAYALDDLAGDDVDRVAIANPEHAPYGRAAEEALRRAGLLGAVRPKLVLGENVADAQRLARSGEADAAIVALSLAIPSAGAWTPIPARLHEPIEQALVVTGSGARGAAARAFAAAVNGREGRDVMRRYGFVRPGERPGR